MVDVYGFGDAKAGLHGGGEQSLIGLLWHDSQNQNRGRKRGQDGQEYEGLLEDVNELFFEHKPLR